MTQERSDILNGWKEIATYVGRDTRTVERWEKLRGLPVRRVPGAGRATVYAITSELDAWFKSGSSREAEELADGTSVQAGAQLNGASGAVTVQPLTQFVSQIDPLAASLPSPSESEKGTSTAPQVLEPDPESAQTPGKPRLVGWHIALTLAALLLTAAAAVLWVITYRNTSKQAGTGSAKGADGATNGAASGTTAVHAASNSTVPGVNELVMRGMYAYEQRTPQSLRLAEQYFTEATTRDAKYAPGFAGLADTYLLQREYTALPDAEAYPKALAAAQKAAALDPGLAQAHTSLGFIDFFWLAQPAAAEHEFKAALAAEPGLGLAHHWYGSVLTHEGRYQEALRELDEAQRLSPNSSAILSTRALALGLSGRRQEAISLMQEVLNESPGTSSPHLVLSILSLYPPRDMRLYMREESIFATTRHDAALMRRNDQVAREYARGGELAVWSFLLTEEERAHPAPQPRTLQMAAYEFGLGRTDEGFADVQTAIEHHDRRLATIQLDPLISPEIHADPRYRKVLDQIGLSPLLGPDALRNLSSAAP